MVTGLLVFAFVWVLPSVVVWSLCRVCAVSERVLLVAELWEDDDLADAA